MAKGARLAVRCADLTPHTWEVEEESVMIGGFVRSMAWDPLGERLAVIFKGTVMQQQGCICKRGLSVDCVDSRSLFP